ERRAGQPERSPAREGRSNDPERRGPVAHVVRLARLGCGITREVTLQLLRLLLGADRLHEPADLTREVEDLPLVVDALARRSPASRELREKLVVPDRVLAVRLVGHRRVVGELARERLLRLGLHPGEDGGARGRRGVEAAQPERRRPRPQAVLLRAADDRGDAGLLLADLPRRERRLPGHLREDPLRLVERGLAVLVPVVLPLALDVLRAQQIEALVEKAGAGAPLFVALLQADEALRLGQREAAGVEVDEIALAGLTAAPRCGVRVVPKPRRDRAPHALVERDQVPGAGELLVERGIAATGRTVAADEARRRVVVLPAEEVVRDPGGVHDVPEPLGVVPSTLASTEGLVDRVRNGHREPRASRGLATLSSRSLVHANAGQDLRDLRVSRRRRAVEELRERPRAAHGPVVDVRHAVRVDRADDPVLTRRVRERLVAVDERRRDRRRGPRGGPLDAEFEFLERLRIDRHVEVDPRRLEEPSDAAGTVGIEVPALDRGLL